MRPDAPEQATAVAPTDIIPALGTPEFTFTRRQRMRLVPHYVYIAHGSISRDDPLYIGQTHDPSARLRSHRKTSEWWEWMRRVDFYRCANRTEALALERRLISRLSPRYNVAHNYLAPVREAA